MIGKITYSIPGIWRITDGERSKKLAGNCEITALKLSSGSGAAFVSIYDIPDDNYAGKTPVWVLDCSTTDNDTCIFPSPLLFKNGLYAVCEQGWDLGAYVSLSRYN